MEIWKYELPVQDIVDVPMPDGATILSVQEQRGAIALWALVDPDEATRRMRRFRIAGTGYRLLPEGLRYIGTVQIGAFVWHVFEFENLT